MKSSTQVIGSVNGSFHQFCIWGTGSGCFFKSIVIFSHSACCILNLQLLPVVIISGTWAWACLCANRKWSAAHHLMLLLMTWFYWCRLHETHQVKLLQMQTQHVDSQQWEPLALCADLFIKRLFGFSINRWTCSCVVFLGVVLPRSHGNSRCHHQTEQTSEGLQLWSFKNLLVGAI